MAVNSRITEGDARQAQRAQMVAARLCGAKPPALIAKADGDARTAFARQLAMYFASRIYRFNHARIAAMFGRGRGAALHACRRIEALREDPKIDWQLFEAETLLRAADLMARDTDDAP